MELTTTNNQLAIYDRMADPLAAVEKLGEIIARSGMFGCDKVEQGQVLALQCIVERKPPLELAKNYNFINGKLAMKADAMLAEYRKRGGKVVWKKYDEKIASADWMYDGNVVSLEFTMEEAKRAQLAGKQNYQKNPAEMLRARLISKAIRMLAPEVCTGVYTPEETADFTHPVINADVVIVEDELEKLLEPYKETAINFFVEKGWLSEGQKIGEIDEARRNNILKNPKPLLEVLHEISKRGKETENS